MFQFFFLYENRTCICCRGSLKFLRNNMLTLNMLYKYICMCARATEKSNKFHILMLDTLHEITLVENEIKKRYECFLLRLHARAGGDFFRFEFGIRIHKFLQQRYRVRFFIFSSLSYGARGMLRCRSNWNFTIYSNYFEGIDCVRCFVYLCTFFFEDAVFFQMFSLLLTSSSK